MPINLWVLLLINVFIGVVGQLLLKHAVSAEKNQHLLSLIRDWKIFLAVFCYVLNLALYLVLLSRQNLGYIFAMQVSLGIIAVNIAGVLVFREQLSFAGMSGIAVIILGIFLLNIK